MIKLNFKDDISVLSDHVSIQIHNLNLCQALALFAVVLADKKEEVEIVGGINPIFIRQSGKKFSSATKDGSAFHYFPDEQMLKTIVGILGDMALGRKFDANHIDFDLRTKASSMGLTLQFAESFYETRLAWEK